MLAHTLSWSKRCSVGWWMFMVGVHNIALAEQSSSILAVYNGAMRDSRCCYHLHLERGSNAKLEHFIAWPTLRWVTVVSQCCAKSPQGQR